MNKSCFFCGLIGIITNLMIGISKLLMGILSNSITLIEDACNNLTDMTSSFILVIFNKCNKEYLSSIIISIIMTIMSLYFIYCSFIKIIYSNEVFFNIYTFIVLIITLLIKIIQYSIYKYFYNKDKIKTIKVILIETKNDIITSISIIISISFMYYLNINIDGYIGLIVSIYVFKNSIESLKDNIVF